MERSSHCRKLLSAGRWWLRSLRSHVLLANTLFHYGNRNLTLIGISQNDRKDTATFVKEYGVTFPIVLDDIRTYPVSNAYGLTNAPTIFWIARDGEIEILSVGWVKSDFAQINRKMAESAEAAQALVFRPGEDVRDFRAA